MTPAWTKLRYHAQQSALWRTRARFRAVAAGRGSGKTELCRRRVVRWLPVNKPWPDPIYFYALPTRDQAKRVAWPALKALIPPEWLTKNGISESELTITTVFGSKLFVLGMDKPARAEGVQWDGGVVDESCDQRPKVFDLTLRPALAHRQGWCDRIGVPKRAGPGAKEFKDFYEMCDSDQSGEYEAYSWPSSDIMRPEEIASARSKLDEKDYNEQYNASWETIGGAIFYSFSDVLNVSDVAYDPRLPLLIGCDFNVDPMAWVICQAKGDELHAIDELFIRNTNTEASIEVIRKRYGEHRAGFRFFGDATGRARRTSASTSDYVQIRNSSLHDSLVMFPEANPPRADRFASCNALFKNAAGIRRFRAHPRCVNLIRDLNTRAYSPETSEPDDYGDIGHITDALGYLIHWLYPLRLDRPQVAPYIP